jgi:transcription elongation factor GreA
MGRRLGERHGVGMADQRPPLPDAAQLIDAPPVSAGVLLTAADFEALERELDLLRNRHRAEFARNLRDARAFGSPGENDDVLTVFEEAVVDEARIAQLEEIVRTASVLENDLVFDGRAGLGCAVRVVDDRGRTNEYTLIGRRLQGSPTDHVSLASPVGKALAGTSAGDSVRIALPNGRDRELRVIEVTSRVTDGLVGTAKAA